MPLSRRAFLNSVRPAAAGPAWAHIADRGREAFQAAAASRAGAPPEPGPQGGAIRLDSNENPLGPGPAAMEALHEAFQYAGRYPTNAHPNPANLRETIARRQSVRPENVLIGSGSWELLRIAVRVFTSSSRPLATASPTFEQPERMAEQLGVPVRRVPVDAAGRLDLEGMAAAARWAGLVFFCNPNNPTSTVHPARAVADFVARVRRESPETAILIDEAYHDYVTDPGYATALPLALEHANVFVTRTLSKAYGMAGLRVGYALGQARTIENLSRWIMTFNQNSLALAAASAALSEPAHIEAERVRNSDVREFTARFFRDAGFKVMDSQTNFVFVEIGRPAREFREACQLQKVLVGRDFPPFEKTCARVSLGTMEEMQRASAVFSKALGMQAGAAGGGGGSGR